MTREKKIKEEKEITALICLYIIKQQYFDYWLEDMDYMTSAIYRTTKVPQHRIRRYFYKNIDWDWLTNFIYQKNTKIVLK